MLNKWIGIGRAGNDATIRYTQDGTPVAQFNLATTKSWKGRDGQKQEKTTWHKIIAWRKLAEITGQYVKKGSLLYVEGELEVREYEDKQGVKRKTHEIIINDMKMLGGGKNEGTGSSVSSRPAPSSQHDDDFPAETEDDDFPL
jgi:single-strand DNA-binding protein